jgi:hypothetical protein
MDSTNYDDQALFIYIAYSRLQASCLSRLLGNLSFIADRMSQDYFIRFPDRNYDGPPTLDIGAINTGNSVKIKLIEGWLPKIGNDDENDLVVSLPKPLGITLGLGYLLLSGFNQYLDIEKKLGDERTAQIEYQLKQHELAKAMRADSDKQSDSNSLHIYIDQKIPTVKPVLDDTIKLVLHNKEIKHFEINGVVVKNTP